jgi:predicted nucleic acid-binding protein
VFDLILAAAIQGYTATILSEDLNAGQMVEGVQIENPLTSPSPRGS